MTKYHVLYEAIVETPGWMEFSQEPVEKELRKVFRIEKVLKSDLILSEYEEPFELPTAYGSVVSGANFFGTRYKYVLVGPGRGRWEYVAANGVHYSDRELLECRKNLRVEYDAGKAGE